MLTLLHRRIGIGQEAEVTLVVPADQGHIPFRLDLVLATGRRRGRAGQHRWWEACTIALPGAEQTAAVDPCGEDAVTHVPSDSPGTPTPHT